MIADTPAPLIRHWAHQLRALAPTVCDSRLRTELLSLAEAYETAADCRSPDEIAPQFAGPAAKQQNGSATVRDAHWRRPALIVSQNTP